MKFAFNSREGRFTPKKEPVDVTPNRRTNSFVANTVFEAMNFTNTVFTVIKTLNDRYQFVIQVCAKGISRDYELIRVNLSQIISEIQQHLSSRGVCENRWKAQYLNKHIVLSACKSMILRNTTVLNNSLDSFKNDTDIKKYVLRQKLGLLTDLPIRKDAKREDITF